jgi:hypothetical protein
LREKSRGVKVFSDAYEEGAMTVKLGVFNKWRKIPIEIGETRSYCGVLPENKPNSKYLSGLVLLQWVAGYFQEIYRCDLELAALQVSFPAAGEGRHIGLIEVRFKGIVHGLDTYKVRVEQVKGSRLLLRASLAIKM